MMLLALPVLAVLLAACDGESESAPTPAPRATIVRTATPAPTVSITCIVSKALADVLPTIENQLNRMRDCLQIDLTRENNLVDGTGRLNFNFLEENRKRSVCEGLVTASGWAGKLVDDLSKADLWWLDPLAEVFTTVTCPLYSGYLIGIIDNLSQ
jgi:hypothetical protein